MGAFIISKGSKGSRTHFNPTARWAVGPEGLTEGFLYFPKGKCKSTPVSIKPPLGWSFFLEQTGERK